MDFAWAINALKAGLKVTRQGWNGKGMFLWLMPATDVKAEWCKEPVLKGLAEANGGTIPCLGTIRMYTHDSTGRHAVLTGWLASQSDMLSDDWKVYFGEGHEKQTPEEIEAYKKLMLDRMPGGPFSQQMLELGTLKAQQEKADKVDRIVCAISDIAQFADDLAEGASEQLGIKVGKRDILVAIVDAIIQAGETDTPVKELLQNAYEKALKSAGSNHA